MVIVLHEFEAFWYNYMPTLLCATPIFPTKVAIVEALQSSTHQCSSYGGHTHLQLLDCVILTPECQIIGMNNLPGNLLQLILYPAANSEKLPTC